MGIVKSYIFNASDWTEKDGGRLKRKYGKFKRECIVLKLEKEEDKKPCQHNFVPTFGLYFCTKCHKAKYDYQLL